MSTKIRTYGLLVFALGALILLSSGAPMDGIEVSSYTLTVEVDSLRNSDGVVVFALYNREDAFPDEHYEKYFKITNAKIINGKSQAVFENLPPGKYAVNILHDEDNDGEIKKGFFLPKEGIGFSNYQAIGISNRPRFSKASFDLNSNKKINVKIIYM